LTGKQISIVVEGLNTTVNELKEKI